MRTYLKNTVNTATYEADRATAERMENRCLVKNDEALKVISSMEKDR